MVRLGRAMALMARLQFSGGWKNVFYLAVGLMRQLLSYLALQPPIIQDTSRLVSKEHEIIDRTVISGMAA